MYRRKVDDMRYSDHYVLDDSHKRKFNFRFQFSTYILPAAIGFGIILVLLNIYQLYHLSVQTYGDSPFHSSITEAKKAAWIYADKNSHLLHVVQMLTRAGYSVITSLTPPGRWDLMWSFNFPFRKEFKDMLTNLRYDQKVNHLPGNAGITLKVELATTKLRWIPQAFSIPKEKNQFLSYAMENTAKLWVQKSNNHRGIKIVHSKEVDLDAKTTFVQEFIQNPLLIDGKKFDIGIYVVYTSVDPLQVYIYQDDILVRFCTVDYNPLRPEEVEKYVVGDKYLNVAYLPSLKDYWNSHMTAKDALFTYLNENGYDTKHIWSEMTKCIGELFIAKAESMDKLFNGYHTKHNFFEMVRIDFILDEAAKVWLMEVNMSPNLSSSSHPLNALMYMQVIYHTLALVGVASHVDERFDLETKEVIVSARDITIPNVKCKSLECFNSCANEQCRLCNHCLTDVAKRYIKKAFREHQSKGRYARVLPSPLRANSADVIYVNLKTKSELDGILELWFKEKCKRDTSWCQ